MYRKVTKKEVRKGMMLLSPQLNPIACFEFEAEVLILHHPTTIAPNYQAMGKLKEKINKFFIFSSCRIYPSNSDYFEDEQRSVENW